MIASPHPPRSWRPYSLDELGEIEQLRLAGTPWKVIGSALGRSPQYLQRVAKRHGLRLAPSRPEWTPGEIDVLRQGIAARTPTRTIACNLGRTAAAIRACRRRLQRIRETSPVTP